MKQDGKLGSRGMTNIDIPFLSQPAETSEKGDQVDHHMKANIFAQCLREATVLGWKGGAAWWNLNTLSIQETIQPIIKQLSFTTNHHHHNGHYDKIKTPKRRIARHAAKSQVWSTSE